KVPTRLAHLREAGIPHWACRKHSLNDRIRPTLRGRNQHISIRGISPETGYARPQAVQDHRVRYHSAISVTQRPNLAAPIITIQITAVKLWNGRGTIHHASYD